MNKILKTIGKFFVGINILLILPISSGYTGENFLRFFTALILYCALVMVIAWKCDVLKNEEYEEI